MSADPARPQSFVADPPPPLSVTPSSPPQRKQQHLEPPKSPAMDKNNRLSLDSSLMRRNPFARANQLAISTDAAAADVEPGLKSAPPVPDSQQKRHSATFPMAARGFFSFGSPSPPPEEQQPEDPPADCNMSEEEMQGLLEHVRKAENDRVRAESELARREKELARVKNELRRAEGEVEELKAQLLQQQQHAQPQQPPQYQQHHQHQHQRQLSGGLKPAAGSQEEIHPAYRHDSLDPNGRPAEPSPYRHHAYASSTELTANSNASQQSLRPYSCSAAVPPPPPSRNGFPPSPRLTTRLSMISIVEAPRNEEGGLVDREGDADADEDEGVSPKRRLMRRKASAAPEKARDGRPKEKKSSTRLRERFSRMSFFHDKKKDDGKLDFAAEQ